MSSKQVNRIKTLLSKLTMDEKLEVVQLLDRMIVTEIISDKKKVEHKPEPKSRDFNCIELETGEFKILLSGLNYNPNIRDLIGDPVDKNIIVKCAMDSDGKRALLDYDELIFCKTNGFKIEECKNKLDIELDGLHRLCKNRLDMELDELIKLGDYPESGNGRDVCDSD